MESEEDIDIGVLKRRLNHELEPLKVMLVHKKGDLLPDDWLQFVEITRKSILQHPDQYLDRDFPSREVLETLINKIFEDFLSSSKRITSPLIHNADAS